MTQAKKAKIRGLLRWGPFQFVLREDVNTDANALPKRFVPSFKSKIDERIERKTRHVIRVYQETIKHVLLPF